MAAEDGLEDTLGDLSGPTHGQIKCLKYFEAYQKPKSSPPFSI